MVLVQVVVLLNLITCILTLLARLLCIKQALKLPLKVTLQSGLSSSKVAKTKQCLLKHGQWLSEVSHHQTVRPILLLNTFQLISLLIRRRGLELTQGCLIMILPTLFLTVLRGLTGTVIITVLSQ